MRRSTTSPHPAPLPLNCEHAALSSHDATERHAHLQTRHMAVTVLSADVVNALQYGLHPTLARPRRPPKRYKDGNRPCFAMHDGKPTTVKVWAAAPGHRPSSYAVACHIGISECRTEPEINWELLPEFCCDVDDPVPHAASPSGLVRPMWSGNLMTASPGRQDDGSITTFMPPNAPYRIRKAKHTHGGRPKSSSPSKDHGQGLSKTMCASLFLGFLLFWPRVWCHDQPCHEQHVAPHWM